MEIFGVMDLLIKTHFYTDDEELVIIDDDKITFREKTILFREVTGIRTQVNAIEIYRFVIGSNFYFGLRSETDKIELNLNSYFGIRSTYFKGILNQILDILWEPVTAKIWNDFREILAQKNGAINVGNCEINKSGISITQGSLLAKRSELISWAELSYEKRDDRLVISSKANPKLWTNLYYKDCWNIEVIMTLFDWITEEGNLDSARNSDGEFK